MTGCYGSAAGTAAVAGLGPPRRYYRLTAGGERRLLGGCWRTGGV